jgi:hypothetical protein
MFYVKYSLPPKEKDDRPIEFDHLLDMLMKRQVY